MDLGTAMAARWSSGISVYGVTALVGISGRLGWIDAPDIVEQAWVLARAPALFAAEFVIDEIALVDSTWDAVHTVVRPVIGVHLMAPRHRHVVCRARERRRRPRTHEPQRNSREP
jgi:hypothetical protein